MDKHNRIIFYRKWILIFFAAITVCFFTLDREGATAENLAAVTVKNSRWAAPESTFTLPGPAGDGGIFYPDLQASFPAVNWATLDRLYIPAGHYKYIELGNLPNRSLNDPLVITNAGGQVRIGGLGHHYVFHINGGSGWVLTGRYDPIGQTGHPDYVGHADGAYANSNGSYGIYINDQFTSDSQYITSALKVRGRATKYELEFIEVTRTSFAGISLKTDDTPDALMEDVRVHDLYIHDTGGEGMYIGSTKHEQHPQHKFRNLEIYNNRVLRTALEPMQLGQMGDGIKVHNNVFGPGAIGWRTAFQNFQDKNLQILYREGVVEVHHNIFIGAKDSLMYIKGLDIAGDTHAPGDGVYIHNNYFAHFGWLGGFARSDTPEAAHFIEDNYFRGYHFIRDEVFTVAEASEMIRLNQGPGVFPITFNGNRFELPNHLKFVNALSNSDGNGSNGPVSGSGNMRGAVVPIEFVNFGVPATYDYNRIEVWTDNATLGNNTAVSYNQGDIVFHESIPYECQVATCATGLVPPDNPATWLKLPPFPDDVRLAEDSPYFGIGLLPTVWPENVYLPIVVR